MIVAGIGIKDDATADAIITLLSDALRKAEISLEQLSALATINTRYQKRSFQDAADRLRLPSIAFAADELAYVAQKVKTHSPRVMALYGVGSVAEAVALKAAGENAELILPRIACEQVTCALAKGNTL